MPKGKSKKTKPQVIQVVAKPQPRNNKKRKQRKAPRKGITAAGRALRAGGASIASLLGLPSSVGTAAGAGISKIFGQGDYVVSAPKTNSLLSGPPAFGPLTSGFRIRHREYIKDVLSSSEFSAQTFSINPGLSSLFPWLSAVAQNFEEYTIHGMVVYLNSTSATAVSSTNTALGLWGVVTQYDPAEPDFTNKQQCENYVGCQTTVPYNSLVHGVECMPSAAVLSKKYVRSGDIGSEDIKFYDWGKTQIFTQGMQAVSTIGELWVSYDIEFSKPRLPTGGYSDYTDVYRATFSKANPLGPTALPLAGSTIGTSVTSGTATEISSLVFPDEAPVGYYLVFWSCANMASVSWTTPTVAFSGSTYQDDTCKLFNATSLQSTISTPQNGGTGDQAASLVLVVRKVGNYRGVLNFQASASTLVSGNGTLIVARIKIPSLSLLKTKLDKAEIERLRTLLSIADTPEFHALMATITIKPGTMEIVDELDEKAEDSG